MDQLWSSSMALGEFIGSLMLTLGIFFAITVSKRKAFGLDTPLKSRAFLAAVFAPLICISILAGYEFGGAGFINPAIAFIGAMIEMHFTGLPYIIGAELVGGIAATLIFLLSIWGFNRKSKEKVVLKNIFKFNSQHPTKVIGYEWLANIFWLLPIAGLLMFRASGTTSVFELGLAAGLGLAVIVLTTNEWAAPNLNPQIWFGEFILKFIAQRRITSRELLAEILSVTQVIAVGVAFGALAHGATILMGNPDQTNVLGIRPVAATLK